MLDSIMKNQRFIYFLPFETIVIMAHYSFFNVKKFNKNPFDPILSFVLVKDF